MYMQEHQTSLLLCSDGGQSIGWVGDKPAVWFGPAEIMPGMEYRAAREGEVFACLDGEDFINTDGWSEISKHVSMQNSLNNEREVVLW